jgi:hypothetical protein
MSCPEPPAAWRDTAPLRWWPAVVYPAAFLTASLAVQAQPPTRRGQALLWASTNLDNLADHPVRALAVSAFLVDGDVVAWTVLAVLGFAGLVAATGPCQAVAVGTAAHVIGTAASEGSLAVRIARGLEPASQRAILDVGPSFLVVGVLVATVVCAPGPRWRLGAAAGFAVLVPSLFGGVTSWDVSALGHLTAVGLGLVAGAWFLVRARSRPAGGPPPSASGPDV